ncbi:hypothetical protein Y032_0765g2166 [Ancylostoma ceylanicum]|uniref:Uncharacterized protein n=1 Tax=Ancylostoma ceylanicum TaxID=53326 RepID=A0A016WEU2_9BILA|nr:hypothetical protein Y032_0765g2166 [Ancylostoma ceylanicum]
MRCSWFTSTTLKTPEAKSPKILTLELVVRTTQKCLKYQPKLSRTTDICAKANLLLPNNIRKAPVKRTLHGSSSKLHE